MTDYLSLEEIEKECANEHIKANELDILVSKTRELTLHREKEIKRLRQLHEQLVKRLESVG